MGVGALAVYLAVNWTSGSAAPALTRRRSAPAALATPAAPGMQGFLAGHAAGLSAQSAESARSGSSSGLPGSAPGGKSPGGAHKGGVPSVDAETWRSAVAATAAGKHAAGARTDAQHPKGTDASLSLPGSTGAARSAAPQGGHHGAPHWAVRDGTVPGAGDDGGAHPNPKPGSAASPLEGVPFARLLPWLLRRSIG